jgi:hypothetical protein
VIENFEIVKSFKEQYNFNLKLQKNYKSISKTNIFDLHKITDNQIINTEKKNKNLFYINAKKNFANRLLAFFQSFSFKTEKYKDGFIEVELEVLWKTNEFTNMLNDFCLENNLEDSNKFLRECFTLLEKQSLGQLVDNSYIEIKSDNIKVKNEIFNILKSSKQGTTYLNIYDHICKHFENFYCTDYVKFILQEMITAGTIFQLGPNEYNIV